MADVLVTGIKIGDMSLKGTVSGNEKLPTGDVGDLAVTPNQIKNFTIQQGNLVNQEQLDDAIESVEQTASGLAGRVQTLENRTSNVNNTADLDKPVSNATQAALDLKANKADVYDKTQVYNKTEIDGKLDLKANVADVYNKSQVYQKSETYSKSEVDSAITGIQHNNLQGRNQPNAHPASSIQDFSGKSQQEINDDLYKKTSRVVWVNDYGDVGNGQDATQAFRSAVLAAGVGGKVAFDDGDYLLTQPTNILSGQEIFGTGKTTLINGFDRTAFPRGTVAGLMQWGFSLDGLGTQTTIYSIGTLATATTMFTNTLVLAADPPSSLKVGSIINLHYFCARVLAISGNTLTLDRTCPYIRDIGSTVYAFNEVNNVHIHDFDIDFNGTESNIRWGYGILGQGGQSNRIENINGQYIGSKMVQLSKDVDSVIKNLNGFIGTDNLDTGGHGYVLRLASGTDSCYVENVTGTKVRHVTEVSGAHRNRFFKCKGVLTDGVAHLTHGSSSYDNRWIDCDADYCSAAYHSWDGDTFNQFIGGDVKGRLTNASVNYDPSVVLRGQIVTNPAGYSGSKLYLEDLTCTFTSGQSSSMFRYSGTGSADILVKNSKFRIEVDASNTCLVYANGTGAVNITFENCEFTVKKISAFISMNAASKVTFKNCKLICDETLANTPLIVSDGIIEVIGGNFEFVNSGLSFFGLNLATSKLVMDGVTFVNASQVWRRYVTGSFITIGRNTLVNSTFATFPNINWSSIGTANNVPYPPGGTWTEGSRIENPTPTAGGYNSYILLNGVWKGVGAIQA
ncbi:hypothetical protein ACT414_18385 (plasmid) [Acinetobacter baumannii]